MARNPNRPQTQIMKIISMTEPKTEAKRIQEELFLISDEWLEDAERLRDGNKGWTGDEKWFQQRKGSARAKEQAADRIRELAQSIPTNTDN